MKNLIDVEVRDCAIPLSLADSIERKVLSDVFPWYLIRDVDPRRLQDKVNWTVAQDENTVNTVQFGYAVYSIDEKNLVHSSFAETKTVADCCCENFDNLSPYYLRLKFNLLLNHTLVDGDKYNTPHIDSRTPSSYSMIYYVNDSDGDTVIFNEMVGPDKEERPEKLTVKRRITPKKNRMVIFDGSYLHASTNPVKSEKRVVLNINMLNNFEGHEARNQDWF